MSVFEELAPAKVNLALRIVGRREDGYHLLESLVMFVRDVADVITLQRLPERCDVVLQCVGAGATSLMHECPEIDRNLAWRAASLMRERYAISEGVQIMLRKEIPSQAGLGGGSADAAAVLRAMNRCFSLGLSVDALAQLGAVLGADVPMCVYSQPLIASGIGDDIHYLKFRSSAFPIVLVKPPVAASTPAIFKALAWSEASRSLMVDGWEYIYIEQEGGDVNWTDLHNDLAAPACEIVPEIQDVLTCLRLCSGVRYVQMSGSGSACFGIFENAAAAKIAYAQISSKHPDWWVASGTLS